MVSLDANASFTWTLTIPEDASYDIAWFCADFYNASSVTDQAKYQLRPKWNDCCGENDDAVSDEGVASAVQRGAERGDGAAHADQTGGANP